MKERKIQLTGGSTYTVSLPKEWAKETGLEPGDLLCLYPRDSQLVIEPPQKHDETKQTTVAVGGFPDQHIRRIVLAFYTSGYSIVTFTAQSGFGEGRRAVAETARQLIGLEIIESGETRITLKNLLDSATVSAEQSTEQIQQVTLSMHRDAVSALLERDRELAEHTVERDTQIDRLYAMIVRQFQRSLQNLGNTETRDHVQAELYDYQMAARQFERIADHAEKLARLATRFENPPEADFADRIERLADASRTVVAQAASTVLKDGETERAQNALDRRDELIAEIKEVERELHERDVAESHLIALTLDSLSRTAEYGGNIAELSLNAAARSEQL